jgi:hypothetical protein
MKFFDALDRREYPLSAIAQGRMPCFHRITRSARANTFGGIVRPICLAAFRLMMNSNFLGCSTVKSAGFCKPHLAGHRRAKTQEDYD